MAHIFIFKKCFLRTQRHSICLLLFVIVSFHCMFELELEFFDLAFVTVFDLEMNSTFIVLKLPLT